MHRLFHTREKSEITIVTLEVKIVAWESLEMAKVLRLGISNHVGV